MCGLFAYLRPTTPLESGRVDAAMRALKPRGPDATGVWTGLSGRVLLGHTRLSIVAPNSGQQPLFNETGNIVAVVNGEFYGFESIRHELRERGHVFATGSDSEILIHLYEEMGMRSLKRLRGEFAFVLWDGRQQRLIAARDRFGIKPVVFARHEGAIYFASDIKTLFAAGVPARWDPLGVRSQLLAYLPPDATLFAGVHQLPPGCWIEASADGDRRHTYWDLDYPNKSEAERPPSGDEVDRFSAAFHDAVAVRLRADAPVSCMLSGGVDSAAVLVACGDARPRSFTLSFEDDSFDEAPGASDVASHLGVPWQRVSASEGDLVEHLTNAVRAGEMPALNGHAVGRYLLARQISASGYRVALAGDGADDILGGYIHALHDARAGMQHKGLPVPEMLTGVGDCLGFVPAWMRLSAIARSPLYALVDASLLGSGGASSPYVDLVAACDDAGALRGRHPLHQSLYLWCKSILPNYALVGERLEMANALEVRLPFLDHQLFDVVRSLPVSSLVRDGEQKRVLRQALEQQLPQRLRDRSKRPFAARPSTTLSESRLVDLVRLLISQHDTLPPFFRRGPLEKLLAMLPRLDHGTLSKLDPIIHMVAGMCLLQLHFKPTL